MKESIFLSFGFFLLTASLFAQQAAIGIRAGYTLSDVRYVTNVPFDVDLNDASKHLSSFHAGVDAQIPFENRFSAIASLLYARKGHEGKVYWPTGPADATWELHYLNLLVVADYRVWKGLALQGGVEFGRLLSARLKSGSEEAQIDDSYEDFDTGLVAGLEYRTGNGFFIGVRQVFGIYNINGLEYTDGTIIKIRNSATQFSVGYRHVID